jgi:sugar lactone lactonase YvrE
MQMKSLDFSRYLLGSCVAVAMLAGCGGSQPPIDAPGAMPQSTAIATHANRIASTPEYKASGPLLYVTNSDGYNTAVTIYDPKTNDPSTIAVITKSLLEPEWDCIDGDGTLYVANDPGSGLGWVSEYALSKTKPLRLITEGINIPGGCAVDDQGNLWVTNFGGPTVTEYFKGSTKPHTTLTSGLTFPNSVAIDYAGNIYVGNLDPYGTSNVQVFAPGGKSPSRTITDGVTWPEGIAVGSNGTLYVPNWLQCNIEEYLAGHGDPYRTITTDIDGPEAVTFAKNGWMYVVNGGNQSCHGPYPAILEFPPRSVKPSSRTISKDLHDPGGVAYYPPLLP